MSIYSLAHTLFGKVPTQNNIDATPTNPPALDWGGLMQSVSESSVDTTQPGPPATTEISHNPAQRFIDNDDGTVTDTSTSLMWMRCVDGQEWCGDGCAGDAKRFTWDEAMTIRRDFAGFDDWRLPTSNELKGIVDPSRSNPVFDPLIFLGSEKNSDPLFFWTSSSEGAYISSYSGSHGSSGREVGSFFLHSGRNTRHAVRLVRDATISVEKKTTTASSTRFIDNGDGAVTDTTTALMWMRCALGQTWDGTMCVGNGRTYTWHEAMAIRHTCAGYSDWRLPGLDELNSIVDKERRYPALDPIIFPHTDRHANSRGFWSATQHNDGVLRWYVAFGYGKADCLKPSHDLYVRLVRREQLPQSNKEPNHIPTGDQALITTSQSTKAVHEIKPGIFEIIDSNVENLAIPELSAIALADKAEVRSSYDYLNSAEEPVQEAVKMSFLLDVFSMGSGTGTVTRNPEAESYTFGNTVSLTAHAAEGSIFIGWGGKAAGLDTVCTVTMDSAKSVTAEFARLDISDLAIGVAFDSANFASMKSGDDALIIYLSIVNKGQKQIRIELPLSTYVTCRGEEIEQDAWLTGHVNGVKGATIGTGAFRKAGLVFFKSKLNGISAGDHIHLIVSQTKPSRRFNFSFKCTDEKSRAFTLINAAEEDEQAQDEIIAGTFETADILKRLELLETGLSDILRKLETLQAAPPAPGGHAANRDTPTKTFPQVLAWLATQDRIAVSALRSLLLPLDLLPSAVIDELNERTLNLTGDIALEEIGEEIFVTKEVLAKVVAAWE